MTRYRVVLIGARYKVRAERRGGVGFARAARIADYLNMRRSRG